MGFIKNTFVIMHIRVSDKKLLGVSLRMLITIALIFLMILNLFNLLSYTTPFDFVLSAIYCLILLYVIYCWYSVWLVANRMLNKAIGPDVDLIDDAFTEVSTSSSTDIR